MVSLFVSYNRPCFIKMRGDLPEYIESDSSGRLKLNFSKGIKSEKGKMLLAKIANSSIKFHKPSE